jgi:hypothetical protein
MPRTRKPVAAVAIAALALVAACTPASDQPSAEQALCDSLTAFNESVQAIADLDPQTDSVEDAQAAAQAADDAWTDVEAAAADVAEADDAALGQAWSDLSQTIGDLPTDAPIADNWEAVQSGIDDVQGVYAEMRDGAGCSE